GAAPRHCPCPSQVLVFTTSFIFNVLSRSSERTITRSSFSRREDLGPLTGERFGAFLERFGVGFEAAAHLCPGEKDHEPSERPIKALMRTIKRAAWSAHFELLITHPAENSSAEKMHPPADPFRRFVNGEALGELPRLSKERDREAHGISWCEIGLDANGERVPLGVTRKINQHVPDELKRRFNLDLRLDGAARNFHKVHSFLDETPGTF